VAVVACTGGPTGPAATRPAQSSAAAAPAAASGRARPAAMLVWTPRHLPAGFAWRVARLPGVQRMVAVMNGTAWLTASFSASGRPVTRPPRGMAVPVDVTGAVPSAYAAVAAPAQRAVFGRLGDGTALLGATSAQLRHLGAGGLLRFGSRRLRIAGVVPDAAAGFAEVFVSAAQAASMGIGVPRYLLLTVRPGSDARALARRIRAVVPAGTPVRIRLPGRASWLREADAVLPPVLEKAYFGEFAARRLSGNRLTVDPAWQAAWLRTERVPLLGAITCNAAMFAPLRAALRQLVRRGLSRLVSPRGYGGCYAPRLIPGDPGPAVSHHAWGTAIDLNVAANPLGTRPRQDRRLVAIMAQYGLTWGGRWLTPDGMHFELIRPAAGA
jgi:D-alanyl-D-alanine carboxypeptidase